jgi:hypothetical protein
MRSGSKQIERTGARGSGARDKDGSSVLGGPGAAIRKSMLFRRDDIARQLSDS